MTTKRVVHQSTDSDNSKVDELGEAFDQGDKCTKLDMSILQNENLKVDLWYHDLGIQEMYCGKT